MRVDQNSRRTPAQATESPSTLAFVVDKRLPPILAPLQRTLQRTVEHVAFGLQASEQTGRVRLDIPETYFQLSAAQNARRSNDTVKETYQTWLLGVGLRDCVEGVQGLLEHVRRYCRAIEFVSWGRRQKEAVRLKEEEDEVEARRFTGLGLPRKLEFLRDEFGPGMTSPLVDHLRSINTARNCLVHSQGEVSVRSANSAQGLKVRWTAMAIEIVREGEPERRRLPLNGPLDNRDGKASARMFVEERMKTYKVGEHITLTGQEFVELCWTLLRFGEEMAEAVHRYGMSRGVKAFNLPPPATIGTETRPLGDEE